MSTPEPRLERVRVAAFAACLLVACGEGGEDVAVPAALPADAAEHTVVLDMQVLTSLDAAARHAAREHGAPGEGERVRYVVRSCRPSAAASLARGLAQRGFEPVIAVAVPCR